MQMVRIGCANLALSGSDWRESAMTNAWRCFAWFRLVRIWCCLRFDDHRMLLPSTLRLVGGSLKATLVRTKNTGIGKRREELYLHLDAEAFIFERTWLRTRFELWMSAGTAHDYFLMLQSACFNDFKHLGGPVCR